MKELSKAKTIFLKIKEKIIKGELVCGDRLSPVRMLAGEFNVSRSPILKAFNLLEKENLITRVNKSGVYIGTKTGNIAKSFKKAPEKTRAEKTADKIITEIIQGTVKVGEYLPLKKVLAFTYATSTKTIDNAIEILIEKKYIHPDRFRYMIGRPTVSTLRSSKKHVYILANQRPEGWKFQALHDKSFFQPFELELQKYGVTSLEYLNLWNEPGLINKVEEATTAGFLMDFNNISAGTNEPENLLIHFKKTTEVIGKKNLPLIVDSYNDVLRFIPNFKFKPMPNLFFIGRDDYEAGEKLGTYLASLGHHKIAYFNIGKTPWNQERFKGMECAIKRHFGSRSNVSYFHEESNDVYWGADLSTYESTPKEEKRRFLDSFSGLFKGYQFKHADPIQGIYPYLADRIFKDIIKKGITPIFEKALKIKEITAWVGPGPTETIAAKEFLMEQKTNIPDEISLVCFDDNENTMEYGITTYNFMEGKAAYLAAHCLLGDIPIKKNRKGFVEYEGQIMVRKSVKAI
jgi:DNA-binding transcriptional regulator YhcF (GntR family)